MPPMAKPGKHFLEEALIFKWQQLFPTQYLSIKSNTVRFYKEASIFGLHLHYALLGTVLSERAIRNLGDQLKLIRKGSKSLPEC
jgi:hypothetical protein